MRIRYLAIRRFRGIRELDWSVRGRMICLIGQGDSTKSTILDAIDYAISARWDLPITDADFYLGRTDEPIEIAVTIGDLPKKLLDEKRLGLLLRGWNDERGVCDEPEDDCDPVISVRLTVDKTLEPNWTIFTERQLEERRISYQEREELGVLKLGSYVDRHFSWGRGSALSHLTGDVGEIAGILAEAGRSARKSIAGANLAGLETAAEKAELAAKQLGVKPASQYHPGLDSQSMASSSASLALHDGDIPARMAGLGSRRLLAVALQRSSVKDGGIQLIDEVEHGLEPYRLRHLVQTLRPSNDANDQGSGHGQTVMTTHSSVTIVELHASELYVVRSELGKTTISQVNDDLQATIRSVPEALLGHKVIVCEGKTEWGVCRALDGAWSCEPGGVSFAYKGVVPITPSDGGGSKTPGIARHLADLGYNVAFLGDSDTPLTPSAQELEQAGICVIQWAEGMAIEQRACQDLPWAALQELLLVSFETQGRDRVLDAVSERLAVTPKDLTESINEWLSLGLREPQIRTALGEAAKHRNWVKRSDWGEAFGKIVAKSLSEIPNSDLARKLRTLKDWVNAG